MFIKKLINFLLQGITIFIVFTANTKTWTLYTNLIKKVKLKILRPRQGVEMEGSSLDNVHDIDKGDIWVIVAAKQLRPKRRCRTISNDSCHSKLTMLTSVGSSQSRCLFIRGTRIKKIIYL